MLNFSEIFEFSKEICRKIPTLKEIERFEWFEWFGPSPIEPFNSGENPEVVLRYVAAQALDRDDHRIREIVGRFRVEDVNAAVVGG